MDKWNLSSAVRSLNYASLFDAASKSGIILAFNCHYREIVTEYHISHARSGARLPRLLHVLLINMCLIDSACMLFELNRNKNTRAAGNSVFVAIRDEDTWWHVSAHRRDVHNCGVYAKKKKRNMGDINHTGKQLPFLLLSRRIMFLDFIYVPRFARRFF